MLKFNDEAIVCNKTLSLISAGLTNKLKNGNTDTTPMRSNTLEIKASKITKNNEILFFLLSKEKNLISNF